MKKVLFLLILISIGCKKSTKEFTSTSDEKIAYLEKNRFDLNSSAFNFPQKDFKILGLGAYHGSAKIEDVEIKMLESLTKEGKIKYYFPELDYSTAHFFNRYLKTGNEDLLKELVVSIGFYCEQERTIEVYEKWKNLKALYDKLPKEKRFKVVGLEWIQNYKNTSKYLLELLDSSKVDFKPVEEIRDMVKKDTTHFALGDLSFAYSKMQNLVKDFKENKTVYQDNTSNPKILNHLIKTIEESFPKDQDREKMMFNNYVNLDKIYNFKENPQFIRIGFFHLEKSREGEKSYPSFFARLIENKIYKKEEVISVIGYYTNSEVVWDELYENDTYKGFTIEAGFGIGDYEKEFFRGIQNLKNTKISDKTLFRLNKNNSPYNSEPDLIEVIMPDKKSNGEKVKEMSTLDFMDYAILISNSKASKPIFEMDKK
ncbi:hypothetical protein WH52_12205 [Tenacibaculum holothuriorum]|uniref:Erythromycin esterase n=1 Tax=Tenacibaculum holothuriorum TaxID=1635173 RepID=A0A1Y2PBV5_9FLAO|nr:hypothetical protein [Tenacibaculum holothuriorum]OSY87219.1 hypothetical protein WH52_12205 [Tenacibaculum holothuriorum]